MTLEERIRKHVWSCDDWECCRCGQLSCPGGEPGHFWHDGCPRCSSMEGADEHPEEHQLTSIHPFGPVANVDERIFEGFEEQW